MRTSDKPRWVWPAAAVWVIGSVIIGELMEPPTDWVRIAFRLILGSLTAWVVVNLILSASSRSTKRQNE